MNIVLEKREYIINENNTAQEQLRDLLENTPKNLRDLSILQELHGDLDFSILKDFGMTNITSISFVKGEITSVINLPQGLLQFECIDNYLVDLEDLPRSLKKLSIVHNYLKKLDLSKLDALEEINISHNQFTVLNKLPETIREIRCDNNQITRLDFEGVENLKILHANNNKIILVENLPDGIVDMKMENNPSSIQFRNSAEQGISLFTNPANETEEKEDGVRKNYLDALNRYFKLKTDYETKLLKTKRNVYKKTEGSKTSKRNAVLAVKPTCIKCKSSGGTIFSKENNRYKAHCGNAKSPCSLHIEIFTGAIHPIYYLLEIYRESTADVKEMIIQQKLDTLFNYANETKSTALFKKELEAYNETSLMYNKLLEKHDECYFNDKKKEEVKKKQHIIFYAKEKIQTLLSEYDETQNKSLLEKAVRIQIEELLPATVELRLLRNEVNEIIESKNTSFSPIIYRLFQYPCNIEQLDHVTGEPPRVIKFSQI